MFNVTVVRRLYGLKMSTRTVTVVLSNSVHICLSQGLRRGTVEFRLP